MGTFQNKDFDLLLNNVQIGIQNGKTLFLGCQANGRYAQKTRRFAIEIDRDAERAKDRGFMYFLKQKNASLCELKKTFYSYFSNANNFYSYVLHSLCKIWIGNLKRLLK